MSRRTLCAERIYRAVFIDHDGTRSELTGRAERFDGAVLLARESIDYLTGSDRFRPNLASLRSRRSEAGSGFRFVQRTDDSHVVVAFECRHGSQSTITTRLVVGLT